MTTAALSNEQRQEEEQQQQQQEWKEEEQQEEQKQQKEEKSQTETNTNTAPTSPLNRFGFSAATSAIGSSSRLIGNLLPKASLQGLTQRKYTLPDKTVASQVLMYRQLLHTKCRPGLRLSRPYQATQAQKSVMHMPWWEQGIEDSGKMVISYDNLIVRLWMNGSIMPFADLADGDVDTMIDEKGLPPIPHEYWVDRLGFQTPDPVTDFRSGGVLSLAMMVHMVESRMDTVQRFQKGGDAEVLPFGITCINVTDMMAKFLMLAKSVDKMDALLSQKPFWRMFADPNAILASQEIALNMLCDVVVEMNYERKIPNAQGETQEPVTVFDFAEILKKTEDRVQYDLLGAGPQTVDEMRSIANRLKLKYKTALEAREAAALNPKKFGEKTMTGAKEAVTGAKTVAVNVFEKIKPSFALRKTSTEGEGLTTPTAADKPAPASFDKSAVKEATDSVEKSAAKVAEAARASFASASSTLASASQSFFSPLSKTAKSLAEETQGETPSKQPPAASASPPDLMSFDTPDQQKTETVPDGADAIAEAFDLLDMPNADDQLIPGLDNFSIGDFDDDDV